MSVYATNKILQHPEALERMAAGRLQPAPVMIDFMPALACNQSCTFCSYGHRKPDDPPERQGWKNMELMSDAFFPLEKARELIGDLEQMGVKAIEITGGGEPLIWPHIDAFLELLVENRRRKFEPISVGLVTNGTALTPDRANLFAETAWKWARVSIDAGYPEHYMATRRVPESHWRLAWQAVALLVRRRKTPDQKIGVGFVVDNTNYSGVYEAASLARDAGADNIRITLAFSPHRLDLFKPGVVMTAREQADMASERLGGDSFRVHNLITERACNLASPTQDYAYCGMQHVRCVVGGDMSVYRCCSQAFSRRGLLGSLAHQSFRDLWGSPEVRMKLVHHDPRRDCPHECLYEQRNRAILSAIDGLRAPHGVFV